MHLLSMYRQLNLNKYLHKEITAVIIDELFDTTPEGGGMGEYWMDYIGDILHCSFEASSYDEGKNRIAIEFIKTYQFRARPDHLWHNPHLLISLFCVPIILFIISIIVVGLIYPISFREYFIIQFIILWLLFCFVLILKIQYLKWLQARFRTMIETYKIPMTEDDIRFHWDVLPIRVVMQLLPLASGVFTLLCFMPILA